MLTAGEYISLITFCTATDVDRCFRGRVDASVDGVACVDTVIEGKKTKKQKKAEKDMICN